MTIGTIVNAKFYDSVRIEEVGRALTIPASLILAIDRVLKWVREQEEDFDIYMVEDDVTGERMWRAQAGNYLSDGDTPWGAIAQLGEELG